MMTVLLRDIKLACPCLAHFASVNLGPFIHMVYSLFHCGSHAFQKLHKSCRHKLYFVKRSVINP